MEKAGKSFQFTKPSTHKINSVPGIKQDYFLSPPDVYPENLDFIDVTHILAKLVRFELLRINRLD